MVDDHPNPLVQRLLLHIMHRMIEDRFFEIVEEFGSEAFDSYDSLPACVREDDGYGCKADDIILMQEFGWIESEKLDGHTVYKWTEHR